jgi:plasmid stabilization system protein ParE
MARIEKVTWSTRSVRSYYNVLNYLLTKFTVKEAALFDDQLQHKLQLIMHNPAIGRPSPTYERTYKTTLHKRTVLYYRYYPAKKEIRLLLFWPTPRNPKRLKY